MLLGLAVIGGACAPKAPEVVSPADFYAKNTSTMLVSFPPGGGTDYGARTFAAFWPDETGGAMIVKNMTAGSGLEMMNYLWTAKPDGLTLGIQVHANSAVWWLNNEPNLKNEYNKFIFIGYFLDDPFMFSTAPHLAGKTIADLQKMEGLKLAVTSVPSWWHVASALMIDIFQLKGAKIISGFSGSADIGVAMGRGEVDGYCNIASSIQAQIPTMANKPLVALSTKRNTYFPDAPTIKEMVTPTPVQQQMLDMLNRLYGGKVVIVPPGTPADRVQFLRDSFQKVVVNKGYLTQYHLRWKPDDVIMKGEDFAKEVDALWQTPEAVKANIRDLIVKYSAK